MRRGEAEGKGAQKRREKSPAPFGAGLSVRRACCRLHRCFFPYGPTTGASGGGVLLASPRGALISPPIVTKWLTAVEVS